MAFNPFHGFRKHSKVIFAILTIICMITFILSFGRGDFFEWLVGLVGAGKKGEVVTTLYGNKVYARQKEERADDRRIANEFMQGVAAAGAEKTPALLESALAKVLGEIPEDLFVYREQLRTAYLRPYIQSIFGGVTPEKEGFFKVLLEKDPVAREHVERAVQYRQRKAPRDAFDQIVRYLMPDRFGLEATISELRKKDRAEEARVLAAVIALEEYAPLYARDPRRRRTYFEKQTDTQSVLDSLVWLHQADSLGIRLTEEGIREEVNWLSPGGDILTGDSKKDAELVGRFFANRERRAQVDMPTLYRALGDELRIRMAQSVILGEPSGLARAPAYKSFTAVAPGEYLDYYRDQRSSMTVRLLPVPVNAFLDAVSEQPGERDLEKFFDRYKGVPAVPWSATPGFKRPQKVALEWIVDDQGTGTSSTQKLLFEKIAGTL